MTIKKWANSLLNITRHRSNFIRERVNLVNLLQKVLEAANIKLASVASDVMGVLGQAMLVAIVEGNTTLLPDSWRIWLKEPCYLLYENVSFG
ncbi:MAG: hypothetical protein ICV54_22250 [Nostoc sp. C3-bin3]|nr:hypothetical protein [Nostoc sp. C3-bin3]